MTLLLCLFLGFHAVGAFTLVNVDGWAPLGFENERGFHFGLPEWLRLSAAEK